VSATSQTFPELRQNPAMSKLLSMRGDREALSRESLRRRQAEREVTQ